MKNQILNHASFAFLLSLLFLCTYCSAPQQPAQEQWIAIFDGSNGNDWTPKFTGHPLGVNHNNVFQFEDSLLKVSYAPTDTFDDTFGHLFYKTPFSRYRLRATYRFLGDQMAGGPGWAFRNNGLMLHCQSPESMGLGQDFPISLEMQLLGGDGTGERPTANLCTPGTHVQMADSLFSTHCVSSSSPTFHGDDWVTVEALVLGDSLIQHIVDGEVVLAYHHPTIGGGVVNGYLPEAKRDGEALKGGYISIQAETHGIEFKRIEVLEL